MKLFYLFFFQPIVETIDNICFNCPNLERFEYKCISEGLDNISTDKDWGKKDKTSIIVLPLFQTLFLFLVDGYLTSDPSYKEPKFQSLTYIKVTFCVKMFHFNEELKNGMETFKNYLSTKCPKLDNPIQLKTYHVGTWDIAEFESKEF